LDPIETAVQGISNVRSEPTVPVDVTDTPLQHYRFGCTGW